MILCGGRGGRLGGIRKGELFFAGGETLLDRQLRVWRAAPGAAEVLGVAPLDRRPIHWPSDLALIADPGRGPFVALHTVAEKRPDAEWLWVVAVDHPHPDGRLLGAMLARARTEDASVDTVLAEDRDAGMHHPMPGLYRAVAVARSSASSFRGFIRDGYRVAGVPLDSLPGRAAGAFEDVDDPAAVARFGLSMPGR